jgi:hypothetical protein
MKYAEEPRRSTPSPNRSNETVFRGKTIVIDRISIPFLYVSPVVHRMPPSLTAREPN